MASTGKIWIMEGCSDAKTGSHRNDNSINIKPGIYCADKETLHDFIKNLDMSKIEPNLEHIREILPQFGIDGAVAYLATEAQIAYFEAREEASVESPMIIYLKI